MKVVQKILSHGLLIAFMVAAFFIVTNRAELFPQWFAKLQASSSKAFSEQPAAPAVPPARTVTRPLPEKTVIKREGAAIEHAAPPGDESGSGETASPLVTAPGAELHPDESTAPAPAAETAAPAVEAPAPAETLPPTAEPAGPAAATPTPAETLAPTAAEPAAPVTAAPVPAETPPASEAVDETGEAGGLTAWQHPGAGAGSEPSRYRPLASPNPADVEQPAGVDTPAQVAAEPAVEPAAGTATPESIAIPEPSSAAASTQPAQTAVTGTTVGPQITASDAQLEQELKEVRGLYWRRDLSGAAAGYQSISKAYPDNANVWGEMGNFYYTLRQTGAATAAYSRAIELLMQQGDESRARQLLDVLYRLDASAARKLEMRLQHTGG